MVFTATTLKVTVILNVASCSLLHIGRRFFTVVEAVKSCKTSICMYQTTRCCRPKDVLSSSFFIPRSAHAFSEISAKLRVLLLLNH